jgi:hypothetical protein
VVQATSGNVGLVFLVPTRGSIALTLIRSWRIEAWGRWFLQGILLGEVSRLTTGISATSLAMSFGVGRVAVTT